MTEAEARRGVARTGVRALRQPLSARWAAAALAGIAVVSLIVRINFARQVHGPFFFMDELGYEQMAKSLAQHGTIAIFGKTGSVYSPLYSVVLAPVYAAASTATSAYGWVKVVNASLMSLSVFPLYGIARSVLSPWRALGIAALSLCAPLMFFTDLEMSENLAYALFLVAVLAMLRTVRAPSVRNDALLIGAIVLASATRLQLIGLFPAALTAVVCVALLEPGTAGSLSRLRTSVSRHRLLFGTTLLGLGAVLVRTVMNGGSLPLAGRYSVVGRVHADPLKVLEVAVQHLAELDFAVGIVPFACALMCAYALVRRGFPRRALIFGAVATATTLWTLAIVAYDAAAFDDPHNVLAITRIHERYLIYIFPLLLVALGAAIGGALHPRIGAPAHVLVAAGAAVFPALIPFGRVINYTIPVESFGLQIFGTSVHGKLAPIHDAWIVAVCVGAFFALGYLYALVRPRPSFAVVMTVIAFLALSSLVRLRLNAESQTSIAAEASHAAWVDAAAKGHDVALIAGRLRPGRENRDTAVYLYAAFENLDIARVYSTCQSVFGAAFGEHKLSVAGNGTMRDGSVPLRARYVVAPAALHIKGRIFARSANGGLELVGVSTPAVTVGAPLSCAG